MQFDSYVSATLSQCTNMFSCALILSVSAHPPQMFVAVRADTLHGISLLSLGIYSIFLKSGHSVRVFFYDAMPVRVMVKIKFL